MAKFKKGDKVVFNGSIHEAGQAAYTVGKEYTVFGYWSESDGKVRTNNNTHKAGVWMQEDNFDLSSLLQVVCVDNSNNDRVLTVGKGYEVTERGQFYKPVPGASWDNETVGVMYKAHFVLAENYKAPVPVDEEAGQFIIWSPQSDKAPHNVFTRAKHARFVARQMLGKHGDEWYVCKLATKYTSTTEVKKEVL